MSVRRAERLSAVDDTTHTSDRHASGDAGTLRDVAAFLRSRRDEILAAWERSARRFAASKGLGGPALFNQLPKLLARFADELEELARGGAERPLDEAAGHGVQRPPIGRGGSARKEPEPAREGGPRALRCPPRRGRARGCSPHAACLGMAESSRVFGPTDRHTIEEMGLRAGPVFDNARLYAEAVRATRLREEILAVVAHDLRSPLNVVAIAAAQLASKLPGEESARVCAQRIQTAVEQMTHLVCDLLDYASIEAGHLAVDLQEHDLAEVIDEALAPLSLLAAKKSLKLHAELPAAPLRVRRDRGRVAQVLGNLVGNAVKFTPAKDALPHASSTPSLRSAAPPNSETRILRASTRSPETGTSAVTRPDHG